MNTSNVVVGTSLVSAYVNIDVVVKVVSLVIALMYAFIALKDARRRWRKEDAEKDRRRTEEIREEEGPEG